MCLSAKAISNSPLHRIWSHVVNRTSKVNITCEFWHVIYAFYIKYKTSSEDSRDNVTSISYSARASFCEYRTNLRVTTVSAEALKRHRTDCQEVIRCTVLSITF